jgi:hypothetical protein
MTITFVDGIEPIISRYQLSSGTGGDVYSPFLQGWELYGNVRGEWRLFDSHSGTSVLDDGELHEFVVNFEGLPMKAIRLCQTGRNGVGSCQMHINGFMVSGDVLGPPELISQRTRFVSSDLGFAMSNKASTVSVATNTASEMNDEQFMVARERNGNPSAPEVSEYVIGSDDGVRGNRESECPEELPEVARRVVTETSTSHSQSSMSVVSPLSLVSEREHSRGSHGSSTFAETRFDATAVIPGLVPPLERPNGKRELEPNALTPLDSDQSSSSPPIHRPTEPVNVSEETTNQICSNTNQDPSVSNQPTTPNPPESASGGGDAANSVNVDETVLIPEAGPSVDPADWRHLITDLSGLEVVRELGSSRFGTVRLFRPPKPRTNDEAVDGFEYFAAKFCNAGDNREGLKVFKERMNKFISLSHPHVMPIVGIVPPTKGTGPIIITPYSRSGALEDVLTLVRQNNPPSFWNDATKLRMIVGLVSGLNYLHNQGIVHRELKPTDLIITENGSLLISDITTSILEEHNYTRASQVGGPSYMAPEVYDDEQDATKMRDPKADIFSFGLILYELLTHQKVFPSAMSAAMIMCRAMSTRPNDRPKIPSFIHPVLRELITQSWNAATTKRPMMDTLWKRMRDVEFNLFPNVTVTIGPRPVRSDDPTKKSKCETDA